MYKIISVLSICWLLLACNSDTKDKKVTKDKEPLLYKPSEMALLMRKMYEYNNVVKTQIIKRDTVLSFPKEFLKIYSATLTDFSDRDSEFDSLAKQFIKYQKRMVSVNLDSTVFYYNRSVNTCVSCHETRCTGPIPKIKKLLVK
jgi:hypothetical protein